MPWARLTHLNFHQICPEPWPCGETKLSNPKPQLSAAQTRRTHLRFLLPFACAGISANASLSAFAQTVSNPQKRPKLVTVGGAITEIVYQLGAQAQLVGTDTTSLFPHAATLTPKVGYMRQLSAEGLLSLKPEALISTTEAGPPVVLDQIRMAGVRVELIEADHTWAEVQRKVRAVGRAAALEREAQQLQAQLDAAFADAQRLVFKHSGAKPRVLFILAHGQSPSVSGEGTGADAVIKLMGGKNALGGFKNYRPMTAEALAAAAPDVILTSSQGIQAQGGEDKFWSRPELALTPAYKRRALIHMEALKLIGFGPRLPEALRELHTRMLGFA